MLTQSKEYIAIAAGEAAKRAMMQHTAVGTFGQSMSYNSVMSQLIDMISKAVEVGIAETLNNMYTNEEFEKDLTLKP